MSQTIISGHIADNKGIAVFNANILLKNTDNFIVAYTSSDSSGGYSLTFNNLSENKVFYLEVSCVGYRKTTSSFITSKNTYDFVLAEQTIDLSEIKIKSKPKLIVTGDTLSYDVTSFSRPEDRSIGDVLKRLPGISVAENGQISYNGKAINNLFIHGDDLMDGRYGLATKVISKEMIKSVDVVQHFQPIKVLKDKVFTDAVAMNLVLRDENSLKLGGQAIVGAGLPGVYHVALNSMMFNKKIKILNSLKANNNGIDLKSDLEQLGNAGFSTDVSNAKPANLLSLGTIGNPDLPKENYYLNNSQLLNTNNLMNLKNGWQVKSNVQLFFDQNHLDYTNNLATYLNGDTINYSETQTINNSPYAVNIALTAMANKINYYFNNKLSLNFDGNYASGNMNFNGKDFSQSVNTKNYNFFNDFNYIPALRNSKNVIDIRWYLGYFNNPQKLNINSGINVDLLNRGIDYFGSNQYLETPTLFNHASLAYRILNERLIQQSYQFGLINERQRFNSFLSLIQNDNMITSYVADAGNHLNWQRDRLFANAEYSIKKESWQAGLSIPVNLQNIKYWQNEYTLDESKNQIFINPSANFTWHSSAEDYFTISYSLTNKIGQISSIYRGAVLTNYRTISANNADLREQQLSDAQLSYNFRRSVIMFFASAKLSYSRILANTITASVLTNDVQYTVLFPYRNEQNTLSISADASKYIIGLKSTCSVAAKLSISEYNQLINTQLYPYQNKTLTLRAKIDSKLFELLLVGYTGNCLWATSEQKIKISNIQSNGKSVRLDENIDLGFSPSTNFNINLIGRHLFGKKTEANTINYLFVDAKARYRLVKWRTDVELSVSNLANIKYYEIFNLSSNQFYVSRYHIRGRMAVFSATFNL